MKKIIKNKKVLIYVITALVLISLILGGIFLFSNDDEEKTQRKETTNNYVAYIKINPSIKIEYSQTCNENTCNDPIVTKYELINEDAKNIYKDIDLLGSDKDLIKVVNLICETARENDIVFDTINIYSDWNKFETYLEEGTELTETVTFNIEITNKNDIEDIIKTDNEIIKYTISFDTNGGSKIDSQEVIKEEKIIKPTNPTRKGYKFIEWQLDGKIFDFDTVITKNITLKAIWEKEVTQNNNSSNNTNNNNSNNTSNDTNNNSNNNQNTNEPTNTTPSEEDAHKGIINLNDNVTYITGTIAYSCDNCISDSVIQKINSYKGITNNGLTSSVAIIKSINIPEGKYSDYDGVNIGVVEDLLIQCGAEMGGGASDWEPKLLTEQVCNEYKLSCDRW